MTKKPDHAKRAHALLSASSAHRWLACPPSAVAAELYPRQDTEFTREGTTAHEIAELIASGREKAGNVETVEAGLVKTDVTQEMVDCAQGYADYIKELTKSPNAMILLEQRVDFSPWVPDGFGTADCIIIQGDTMDVIDYKYGKGVAVSAVDNPQEMLYGLGALNDYGFAYDIANVRLHIYQPRINNISVHELTADKLQAFGDGVKATAALAAEGKGVYTPGEHCRFCPHAGKCRELTRMCLEIIKVGEKKLGVPVLAPFEVADALKMEPILSMWIKRVKDQALTSMLNGEQIPGYKVVEGKLGNRQWIDELAALDSLLKAGCAKEDITETSLLSPAKMDKALGKKRAAELLEGLTTRTPGAPTIAPETYKRPPYNRLAEAQNDFQ